MSKKKIYRAGLIPYYWEDEDIKMLFMIPSDEKYGGKSPQLIKGKIDEGETAEQAAIREATEEAGLFPPNIKGNLIPLGNFLGRTEVFLAEVKDPSLFGDPTTPEEVEKTVWLTPEQFEEEGRQLHRHIVKAATRLIKKKEMNLSNS